MKLDEFAFFNQQLAAMLRDGIPLESALGQLCASMRRGELREELEKLRADLANGVPIKQALASRKLPQFYVQMMQVGVQSNDLPGVLTIVADYYQSGNLIWTRLKGLMVYPAIVLGGTLALSVLVAVLFGAAAVAAFILSKTVLGRYAVAIGSNEEATRLSGVNVDRWKMAIYTLCGTFAGLGGVLMASRLNSAQPALGSGYELDAIAAVVIGGTSLAGGEGTILGTIIGAFVKSVLDNGLRIINVPQEWQIVVTGGIVIGAVYLDILRRRRSK